mgnify:CR=1 FL=1
MTVYECVALQSDRNTLDIRMALADGKLGVVRNPAKVLMESIGDSVKKAKPVETLESDKERS